VDNLHMHIYSLYNFYVLGRMLVPFKDTVSDYRSTGRADRGYVVATIVGPADSTNDAQCAQAGCTWSNTTVERPLTPTLCGYKTPRQSPVSSSLSCPTEHRGSATLFSPFARSRLGGYGMGAGFASERLDLYVSNATGTAQNLQ